MKRHRIAIAALAAFAALPAAATNGTPSLENSVATSIDNSIASASRVRNSVANRNANWSRNANSNANTNAVHNRNANAQHQGQRQRQGQGQGQSQAVRNAGNNTGTSASHSNAQQHNANQSSGNSTVTTTAVGGDTIVYQAPPRNPVASALAPALSSGHDTCMGSTSVGAQGVTVGLSVGSTWTDENCVMLKNSTMLWNIGKPEAAIALMCNNDKVREALELSGTECPQSARNRELARRVSDPYVAARIERSGPGGAFRGEPITP